MDGCWWLSVCSVWLGSGLGRVFEEGGSREAQGSKKIWGFRAILLGTNLKRPCMKFLDSYIAFIKSEATFWLNC